MANSLRSMEELRTMDPEEIEDRLFLAARIHAGYETDAAFVDAVGYNAELYVAKLRDALQKSGLLPSGDQSPRASRHG